MPAISIKDLSPGQPNSGIINYGGVIFGVAGKYSITPTPIYDEADRSVSHIQYLLQCTNCVLVPDTSITNDQIIMTTGLQTKLAPIHSILSTPGLALTIQDIGFDTLIATGVGGTRQDLVWGPKPRASNFRPHGTTCWEFDWVCEFNISRCRYPGNSILAFNYEVTFSVNQEGLQQKTITGYMQVAAIRNPDPNFPEQVLFNVEDSWDTITMLVPYGFRRVENVRSISKAKNRIDFAITDEELTSDAYPAGIVEADIDYELASNPPGLAKFNGTLSGTLTVAPGYPKALALSKYLSILNAKIQELRQMSAESGQNAMPIPVAMSISHGLFTRATSFSVTFILACDVNTLLQDSGIWNVIPGTDYQQWADSMTAAGVWGKRGVAELKFDSTEDKVQTICTQAPPPQLIDTFSLHPFDNTGGIPGTVDNQPDESKQYLKYESRLEVSRQENFIIHRYAQGYVPSGDAEAQDHVVQYQTAPDNFVWLTGSAIRLDAPPAVPLLQSVAGLPVELVHQEPHGDEVPITLAFGHKVFRATWGLLYRVKGIPSQGAGQLPAVVMVNTEPLLGQV